jgi:hypothetical protein
MDSAWSLGILALWTVVLVLAVQLQFLRWTMLMFQRPQRPPEEEQAPRRPVFLIVAPDDDPRRGVAERLREGDPRAELPLVAVLERPPTARVKQRRRRRRRKRRGGH